MKAGKASVSRLHSYHEVLQRLKLMGFVKVFSENLADAIGVTAVQVRKDFSLFGIVGNKKGGYQTEELISQLNHLLGKNQTHAIVVAGSGNIGQALIHYDKFQSSGIRIIAAFETDESKIDRNAKIPILPLSEMTGFIKKNKVKTGIIAVPALAAQQVLNQMVEGGIKGILNFAPVKLDTPEEFILHHVNLRLELETILYFINAMERQKQSETNKP